MPDYQYSYLMMKGSENRLFENELNNCTNN